MLHSAMTAVSVLTRTLPFLLEAYTDPETREVDPALHRMFWSKKEAAAGVAAATGTGSGGEVAEEKPTPAALGPAMVSAAMRLLFTRQLTVDVHSSCDVGGAGARLVRLAGRWRRLGVVLWWREVCARVALCVCGLLVGDSGGGSRAFVVFALRRRCIMCFDKMPRAYLCCAPLRVCC